MKVSIHATYFHRYNFIFIRQIIQNDYIALLIVEIGSKRCFVKDGNYMAEPMTQIIIARSIKATL